MKEINDIRAKVMNWGPTAEAIGQKMRQADGRIFWSAEMLARHAPDVEQVTFSGLAVVAAGSVGRCSYCGKMTNAFLLHFDPDDAGFWGLNDRCDACLSAWRDKVLEYQASVSAERRRMRDAEREARIRKYADEQAEKIEGKRRAEKAGWK